MVVTQEHLVSKILYHTRIRHGLEAVFHRGLLFNCVLVNKLWAKVATQHLWSFLPPIHAFTALAGSPRLQEYPQHVQILDVPKGVDDKNVVIASADFPSLLSVSIDYTDNNANHDGEFFPVRFLWPNLRVFSYRGGALSDKFLGMLSVTSYPTLVARARIPTKTTFRQGVQI